MARRALIVSAAVIAVIALPAETRAAVTLGQDDMGEVIFVSDAESDSVPIGYDADTFNVTIDAGSSVYCTEPVIYPGPAECAYSGVAELIVRLGGGDDRTRIFPTGDFSWPSGITASMSGGDGDDRLTGGFGRDEFLGGRGSDKLVADDGAKDRVLDCGLGDDPNPKADNKDPNPISC